MVEVRTRLINSENNLSFPRPTSAALSLGCRTPVAYPIFTFRWLAVHALVAGAPRAPRAPRVGRLLGSGRGADSAFRAESEPKGPGISSFD